MRRFDPALVVGLAMLALGGVFYFGILSAPMPVRWFLAPILWYAGVSLFFVRFVYLMFASARRQMDAEPPSPKEETDSMKQPKETSNSASVMRLVAIMALVAIVAVVPATAGPAETAAPLYKAKCAMCHGPDGAAKTPMASKLAVRAFSDPAVQKLTDDEMLQAISKGKNKMPGYAGKITPEEMKALVAYVRTFKK